MRRLGAALFADVAAAVAEATYLVELQFADATGTPINPPLRFTFGAQDLSAQVTDAFGAVVGPYTWYGLGGAMGFRVITEGHDLASHQVELALSGVDPNAGLLAYLLDAHYQGRPALIYLLHLSGGAVVAPGHLVFYGRMNGGAEYNEKPSDSNDRPGTAEITLRLTDEFGDLSQTPGIETNLWSHQQFFPGNTLMAAIPSLFNKRLHWGSSVFEAMGWRPFGVPIR